MSFHQGLLSPDSPDFPDAQSAIRITVDRPARVSHLVIDDEAWALDYTRHPCIRDASACIGNRDDVTGLPLGPGAAAHKLFEPLA